MIKVMKIDFNLKTVEGIEVDCDNIKDIDYTFNDNTFTLNLIQNDETKITQTIQKPTEIIKEDMIKEDITPEIIEQYNLFKVEEIETNETEDNEPNIKWIIQELKEELKETDESSKEEQPEEDIKIEEYKTQLFTKMLKDNDNIYNFLAKKPIYYDGKRIGESILWKNENSILWKNELEKQLFMYLFDKDKIQLN